MLNSAGTEYRKRHSRDINSYLLFEGNVVGERNKVHTLKPQKIVDMLSTNNNEAFLFANPLPFSELNLIAARLAHLRLLRIIF